MNRFATFTGAGFAAIALGAGLVGTTAAASAAPMHQSGRAEQGERITGEQAQQAIDAALAAVPGTADHAHTTPDGGYRVKVTTTDGKTVVVTLDASFAVTGQQQFNGRGGKGSPVTDAQRQQAGDAATTAVAGSTVLDVHKVRAGGFRVIVRTADGAKKVVTLRSDYTVVSVQDAKKGKPRGKGHHHKGNEVTGEAYEKAEAAALSAVPGGTVLDVHQKGTGYHVLVRSADGKTSCVVLDSAFSVTSTKTFTVKH